MLSRRAPSRAQKRTHYPHLVNFVHLAVALALLALAATPLARTPLAAVEEAEASQGDGFELTDRRTRTSKTFRNPDGTLTTSLFTVPVHFRNERGAWQEIESQLVPADEEGYAFANRANRFRALFKPALGPEFLRIVVEGKPFAFTPVDAASKPARAQGSRIAYAAPFPGADLRYDVLAEGVKETLVLSDATAPTHYRFLLTPPPGTRVDVEPRVDGSWGVIVPAYEDALFVLAAPEVTDAAGATETRGEIVSLDVKKIGDRFAVDLSLDAKWLHAAERRFPVSLDPTLVVQPPLQDGSWNTTCATCKLTGGSRLSIGSSDTQTWRAGLLFDVGSVPIGANVSDAQLKLYYDQTCLKACGGAHQLDVHRMSSYWQSSTQTQHVGFDASPLTSFSLASGAAAQWMSWNVTETFKKWLLEDQQNFGLLVKRSAEALGSSGPTPPSSSFTTTALRPKLEVTYVDDGLELLPPDTLHANGADLRWTPFRDPAGAAFEKYEIHRSPTANFTPSSSTLLTTIRDAAVTAYRDTTAAPGKALTYKVVANASASSERTVTLPASGQATKTLRPRPEDGKQAYVMYVQNQISCANRGRSSRMYVGTNASSIRRPLLQFDLREIPAGVTVTEAKLSLWPSDVTTGAGTVSVHRATGDWREGSGVDTCTGDGETWYERQAGVKWSKDGGDFEATKVDSLPVAAGAQPSSHNYTVTSLAQKWIDGSAPNLGMLLKLDDETLSACTTTTNCNYWGYLSDDDTIVPTLRPKLTVTYADGSRAQGPEISVASPGPGDTARGTAVTVTAAAGDDRRLDKVEFFADGAPVGSDESAPFSVAWNSKSVGDGAHTLTAKATDDAGNVTTSAGVSVTVDNSAAPTTSLLSPRPYADVVQADAPLAYWRLGEKSGTTAADAMGRYAGSYAGGVTLGVEGALVNDPNTAAKFNGVDGYVSVPNVNDANAGRLATARSYAIEGWVIPPDKPGNYSGFTGVRNGSNADFYLLQLMNTNTLECRFRNSAGTAFTLTAAVSPNVWHHVALTYDGSTLTCYVDGEPAASVAASGELADTAIPFSIGRVTYDWTFARATIDDVALYAKSLTSAQVRAHHRAGVPVAQGDGPLAFWRLGEAAGTTAFDSMGRFNATYGGGVTLGVEGALVNDANTAVKFNGVDGYASVANVNDAPPGALANAGKYSVEGWVIPPDKPGNYSGFIGVRNDSNADFYILQLMNSNTLECRFRNGAGTYFTLNASVTPNVWHHVALVYDGTTLTCYVDGQAAASTASSGKLADTPMPFYVARTSLQASFARATIDDVALYNKALTAEQVKAHYEAKENIVGVLARRMSTISAEASDDVAVTRVEFYVDGLRFAEDTTTPYTASWNTLDAAQPSYDGTHVLTTRAYDGGGQVTTSSPVYLSVANAASTKYLGELSSTAFPQAVTYDPNATTQDKHGIDVTVTNKSAATWSAGDVVVRSRWTSPDAPPVSTDGPEVSLGTDLAAGASRTVTVLAEPPALPDGVNKAQYTLRLDLYSKTSAAWFADKGNKPLENPVIVNKALVRGALGLERYYHYVGEELGAGMQHLVNVANGNSLVRWTPFEAPGRGLATVVDLTYNALEKKCDCPAGNNFSLAISSLTRFGNPIDVHPNKADEIAGRANKYIELTDGDGTTHKFSSSDGVSYQEPAGVHLFLRKYSDTDAARKWALTRPDRVTFFYDPDGFPTFVRDKNGNELAFTLEQTPPGEDPGGPKKRITKVTDAGRRAFTISYWSKAEAKKAQIRGKVQRIADHTGSALDFDYYTDGNLLRLTQRGGTKADGSFLADRSFVFTYTTSDGSGPAIADAAARKDPDPRTSNQSTRLYGVIDPRGNETTFAYLGPGNGENRWKLASRTDRGGAVDSFAYDVVNRETTLTAPMSRVSKYAYDVDGKVVRITNPKNEVTQVAWTDDRHVAKVTEAGGGYTEYAYNANGYVTDEKVLTDRKLAGTADDVLSHTRLEYQNLEVKDGDGSTRDVSANWKTGRAIPHISQLVKKTDPNGMATATPTNDYQWLFAYTTNGDLETVTDPEGFVTKHDYNGDGTLAATTDARGVATTSDPNDFKTQYLDYDANGFPQRIVDANGQTTRFGYDGDGLLRWIQDPVHASDTGTDERSYKAFFDYDSFHRLGRQSAPKSTRFLRGILLWSGADYDRNDNLVTGIGPHEGAQYTATGARTTVQYDAMDRQTLVTGPDTSADPAGERTKLEYDAAGRLRRMTRPKGVPTSTPDDFVSQYSHDALDRVVMEERYSGDGGVRKSHYCYDLAGDLRWAIPPKSDLDNPPADCSGTPPAHTVKYAYDDAHRLLSQTDGEQNTQSVAYDANDQVVSATDENGTKQTRAYNQRGDLVKVVQPFDKDTNGNVARSLTSKLVYDAVGNVKREISPRAWDASPDSGPEKLNFSDYVTEYEYDQLDRIVKIALPRKGSETRTYVHRSYDENGNATMVSLPVYADTAGAVAADKKTSVSYFDPGWIRTSDDPAPNPPVHFDYTAEGWQASRTPEVLGGGALDLQQRMLWEYYPDGQVKRETDSRGKGATSYTYDANDNLVKADEGRGVFAVDEKAIDVEATWDRFDQLVKVRHQKKGSTNWRFTSYDYDLNGNVKERVDNGEETADGTVVAGKAGRKYIFGYDLADRVTFQQDAGADWTSYVDDTLVKPSYFPTGDVKSELIEPCTPAACTKSQETVFTYFLSGDLKTQRATNAAGNVLESHELSYEDLDGRYVNGHMTLDRFRLKTSVADGEQAGLCEQADCTTRYSYDARERLTDVVDTRPDGVTNTRFVLDETGNVRELHDGTAATEAAVTVVLRRTYGYQGDQLTSVTEKLPTGDEIQNYHYDSDGNLDCITDNGTKDDCPAPEGGSVSRKLLEDYAYDGLNRLEGFRRYSKLTATNTTKTLTDSGKYVLDALDRVSWQEEKHESTTRKTLFTYLGLSGAVSEERQEDAAGAELRTKSYGYDVFEERFGMTNKEGAGGSLERFSFGRNPHGDISLLVGSTGALKAAYGYKPYGDEDGKLTSKSDALKSGATRNTNPLNPYRFNDRRYDTGSNSVDMGARRFSPSVGRFLQRDLYHDALDDLDLSEDPLTQNRYAFAGGNPISFVEIDGHRVEPGGGTTRKRGSKRRWRRVVELPPGYGERPAEETSDLELITGPLGILKHGARAALKNAWRRAKAGGQRGARRVAKTGLETLALAAVRRDPGKAVALVARSESMQGRKYLMNYMTSGERIAYRRDPAKGARYIGHAVHRATNARLRTLFRGRFEYNPTRGPDLEDLRTGRRIELTTRASVRRHMRRYRNFPAPIDFVVYRLPRYE